MTKQVKWEKIMAHTSKIEAIAGRRVVDFWIEIEDNTCHCEECVEDGASLKLVVKLDNDEEREVSL